MARRSGTGEFGLIARAFAPLATHRGAFALTDDAAIIPAKAGMDVIVTKDAIVEGVHFLANDPPETVARKLLRVNVSDIAAKGAKPFGYFVAAAFPRGAPGVYAAAFARGLARDQAAYGMTLFGGDTVATPGPATFSCTMFGYAPRGRMMRRRGAKAGDDLWVTGTIGDSGAGLSALRDGWAEGDADRAWLAARYRLPEPPAAFGPDLQGLASAALDVSDGLIQDAGHLARMSEVSLTIILDAIPLSPQYARIAGDAKASRIAAAQAGDDYQILFTAPARKRTAIEALGRKHIVRVSRIGASAVGTGVHVKDRNGRGVRITRAGYTHF
jgi:thiamine-monophosphate kinase